MTQVVLTIIIVAFVNIAIVHNQFKKSEKAYDKLRREGWPGAGVFDVIVGVGLCAGIWSYMGYNLI